MKWLLLFIALLPLTLHADAAKEFDYADFARIPILHEGRIKPLGSFARIALKKIHGDTSIEGMPATAWLAESLFAPTKASEQPLFKVQSAEIIHTLSLPQNTTGFYSFHLLADKLAKHDSLITTLLNKDKKTLSPAEHELIMLYVHVNDFAEITGSFSLLLPLPPLDKQLRKALDLPTSGHNTYMDLLKIRQKIIAYVKDTVESKSDNMDDYSSVEQNMAVLFYRLDLMEASHKNNALLRVIPPSWEGTEEWLSPWMVIEKSAGAPASAALFSQWQKLADAYQKNDAAAWNQSSKNLFVSIASAPGVRPFALTLEESYHQLDVLQQSLIGYGLGLLLVLISLLSRHPHIIRAAYTVMVLSVLLHGSALLMRMIILMRPPVSTLYESMIFVSFVVAALSLWLERHKKNVDGLIIGSVVAILLLLAANVFAADSDTLEVLIAVLNTNFWLATHVVCITTGYGSSLVAGTLAHLWLFKRCQNTSTQTLSALYKRMHTIALIALFFTAIGTMLGGIWADQSWGRFWGWDPKENGALLIVLWLIWLLHGRLSGHIRELGFAVILALINIVVALAWVGVNLLSVGLHSYGFTDLAAQGLLTFCGAELCFISITSGIIYYQKSQTPAAQK